MIVGSFRPLCYRLARLLMVVGQVVLLIVAGTDGSHGPSAVSHVERSGVDRHYAHNEATCVACTVLSLHARGESSRVPVPMLAVLHSENPTAARTAPVIRRDARNNPSRAPPTLG